MCFSQMFDLWKPHKIKHIEPIITKFVNQNLFNNINRQYPAYTFLIFPWGAVGSRCLDVEHLRIDHERWGCFEVIAMRLLVPITYTNYLVQYIKRKMPLLTDWMMSRQSRYLWCSSCRNIIWYHKQVPTILGFEKSLWTCFISKPMLVDLCFVSLRKMDLCWFWRRASGRILTWVSHLIPLVHRGRRFCLYRTAKGLWLKTWETYGEFDVWQQYWEFVSESGILDFWIM